MTERKERIGFSFGMGWLPDYPDFRDYTVEREEVSRRLLRLGGKESVKEMVRRLGLGKKKKLPASVDLRQWCSPIEDQGALGSCTAHAGVALVEYYERRAFSKHVDASRLFLYKVTRNLLHWTGDRGAFLRTTMAALVLFGVPPEEYWPYDIEDFDKEPSSFCYAFAQDYQTIQYFRLDTPQKPANSLLNEIKTFLAAGLPAMFGFSVYSSVEQAKQNGEIPFPCRGETILGGHAVVAVGYDDKVKINNATCGKQTTGALLIRNSWGKEWGDNGYGWLPYEYVLQGLARDWWCLLKSEWIDTKEFGL